MATLTLKKWPKEGEQALDHWQKTMTTTCQASSSTSSSGQVPGAVVGLPIAPTAEEVGATNRQPNEDLPPAPESEAGSAESERAQGHQLSTGVLIPQEEIHLDCRGACCEARRLCRQRGENFRGSVWPCAEAEIACHSGHARFGWIKHSVIARSRSFSIPISGGHGHIPGAGEMRYCLHLQRAGIEDGWTYRDLHPEDAQAIGLLEGYRAAISDASKTSSRKWTEHQEQIPRRALKQIGAAIGLPGKAPHQLHMQ